MIRFYLTPILFILALLSQGCARGFTVFKSQDPIPASLPTSSPSPAPAPVPTPIPAPATGVGAIDMTKEDPLFSLAWFLSNTGQRDFASTAGTPGMDLNLKQTWTSNIMGRGVRILISDDGVESNHEDLRANYNLNKLSKNYNLRAPYLTNSAEPSNADDNHGTAVAGIIAGAGWNLMGSRGVAPLAQIMCANFLSSAVNQSEAFMIDQASGDYDIVSQSWGQNQDVVDQLDSLYNAQLQFATTNYRKGKGTVFVKAAGNSSLVQSTRFQNRFELGNANFDTSNIMPFTINVAALDAGGVATSYTSPGANVWISSFGGEDGVERPALLTTDRSGCTNGYANKSAGGPAFERGGTQNANCNYTALFNGTSGATPQVTGSVALLLEANPNLTWRDIKYILAKTATQIDVSYVPDDNPLYLIAPAEYAIFKSPNGYAYEMGWVRNAAGFNFHNLYGFGKINVDAAVAMARNFTTPVSTFVESNFTDVKNMNVAIPDFSANGVTSQLTSSSNLKIEAVQLRVNITHANIGELALELTSPSGTKSIVVPMNNALDGIRNYGNEILLVNTFYGELAKGAWTLRVIDGRAKTTGQLNSWSLNFMGSAL